MKRAAIGVRMHSGWGALVAVSNHDGKVEVLERRRMVVAAPGVAGAVQPYHFAKNLVAKKLELEEAEKFLGKCFADAKGSAVVAVRDVVGELSARQYGVAGAAVLLASGRALPALSNILASHALIHAAEGEFFRQVFCKACEELELCVAGFRERELDEHLQTAFGKGAKRVQGQISTLGRSLGPPWTADQKMAATAALLALACKNGR